MSSESINGYNNPNRSPLVTEALNEFGYGSRVWEKNIPPWYATASKMHCLGKWIIALALILATLTVGLSLIYRGTPLIVIATTGSTSTVSAAVFSIVVLFKSYWQDPAYRQEMREKIIHLLISEGYDAAKHQYGNMWNRYGLVSNEEIRTMVCTHHQNQKTYKEIQQDSRNNLHQLIEDGIYPSDFFSEQLHSEIQDMDLLEILDKYGWQPFTDKVLPIHSRFTLAAEARLAEISFQTMIQLYGWNFFIYKILTKDSPIAKRSCYEYLTVTPFTQIDYNSVSSFSIAPATWQQKMNELHAYYQAARNCHSQEVQAAEANYQAAAQVINNEMYHPHLTHRHVNLGLQSLVASQLVQTKEKAVAASAATMQCTIVLINNTWAEYVRNNPQSTR